MAEEKGWGEDRGKSEEEKAERFLALVMETPAAREGGARGPAPQPGAEGATGRVVSSRVGAAAVDAA